MVVSGCVLAQIGRCWVQGRLVVAMGHTCECHVVVAGVGALPWHMRRCVLGGGRQRTRSTIRDVSTCVLISPETDSCHAMIFAASYVADRSAACHHLVCAMEGNKQWPPHHDTNWYDPWRLSTGPAPTTFRSGEDFTTCSHSSPTTTTALVGPQPCTERAL